MKSSKKAKAKPSAQLNKNKTTTGKTDAEGISDHRSDDGLVVVGVGASAGGLSAINDLLKNIETDTEMAFVIIEHLSPDLPSNLTEILSKDSKIRVESLDKSTTIEANNAYVITPNTMVSIEGNHIKVSPRPPKSKLEFRPIDHFFTSLASSRKERAIGVILSGMGTDGTNGIRAIHEEGGICIAQAIESAQFAPMPSHALSTGCIDFNMAPKKIGQELSSLAYNPLLQKRSDGAEVHSSNGNLSMIDRILMHVNHKREIDFMHYKRSTIGRRINKRMIVHHMNSLTHYYHFLKETPEELTALVEDLLIKVTGFFRNPDVFESIKSKVLPEFFQKNPDKKTLRIWSVGCSTGEEAYSLAILAMEFQSTQANKVEIQVFASDISEASIKMAREGIYPKSIETEVSSERLANYFIKVDQGYQIRKIVREKCVFATHNILLDPPFSKIDILVSRNLLIYFTESLQKRVFSLFHYSLNPNGYLVLGQAESPGVLYESFDIKDNKKKIFRKNHNSNMFAIDKAIANLKFQNKSAENKTEPRKTLNFKTELEQEVNRYIQDKYSPPGFVINKNMEILQIRGDTSAFVDLAPGNLSSNLQNFIKEEFQVPLISLLSKAAKSHQPEVRDGISMKGDNAPYARLEIDPIKLSSIDDYCYYLSFSEISPHFESPQNSEEFILQSHLNREVDFRRVEKDLFETRISLRSYIEDQESTTEELKASSEELMSANEELQSTNEELQTSKEELQSANEELNTVNDELSNRNAELVTANDDLANLLECIQAPVVMLDKELRIRFFSNSIDKLLRIIPTDLGRKIGDITPYFDHLNLENESQKVLDSSRESTIEVATTSGRWFSMCVKPYKSSDPLLEGIIVSFTDIHELKTGYDRERRLATVLRSSNDAISVQNLDGKIIEWNWGAANLYGYSETEALGMDVFELIPEHHRADFSNIIDGLVNGEEVASFETTRITKSGRSTDVWLTITSVIDLKGVVVGIATTERDITEMKKSDIMFRALLESAPEALVIVNAKGEILLLNAKAETLLGYKRAELVGQDHNILIPKWFKPKYLKHAQSYFVNPIPREMGIDENLFILRKDGTEVPVDVSLNPVTTPDGILVASSLRDITERKKTEEVMLEAKSVSDSANTAKTEFLANMSHEIRTPLAAITGFAELLNQRKDLSEKQRKSYLKTIWRSGKHLSSLIDNILDLSRVERRSVQLDILSFHLVSEINSVTDVIRLKVQENGLDFHVKYESLVPEIVKSDPTRIRQILFNLLGNAVKFTDFGSITLAIEYSSQPEPQLIFTITDTGCGIPEDSQARIFDIFSQADTTTTRKFGGTGLGLHLAKVMTSLLGGDLALKNSKVGMGSTFVAKLPVKVLDEVRMVNGTESNSDNGESNETVESLDGVKVLIIEDGPDNQVLFREILNHVGADVHIAPEGLLGVEAALKSNYDVILMDIQLPDIDGYEATRRIRSAGNTTPIVAITAHAMKEERQRCLKSGFSDYRSKPIPYAELIKVVSIWSKKYRG